MHTDYRQAAPVMMGTDPTLYHLQKQARILGKDRVWKTELTEYGQSKTAMEPRPYNHGPSDGRRGTCSENASMCQDKVSRGNYTAITTSYARVCLGQK